MVRDHGHLSGPDAQVLGDTDRVRVWRHCPRGDDLAVLRRDDRRSLPGHRAGAGAAASRRRTSDVRGLASRDLRRILPAARRLRAVLHADARAHELAVVRPYERAGPGVPRGAGARHDRLDRGRTVGRAAAHRADGRPTPDRGLGIGRARTVLAGVAPHATACCGARVEATRRPRSRCAQAHGRPVVRDVHRRVVFALHPVAVLLRLHEPLSERDRATGAREQDELRADVGARLHAAPAAAARPPRRQTHLVDRHGRVGIALRVLRVRQYRTARVDAVRRDPPARAVLRFLLRHRPDLRRSARAGRDTSGGARVPGADYPGGRIVHRRLALRPYRGGLHYDPWPQLARDLVDSGRVRLGDPAGVRCVVRASEGPRAASPDR
jgi:hypothetical protein